MKQSNKFKLFSLIELLIIIAIFSIIASILQPSLQKMVGTSKTLTCQNSLKEIYLTSSFYSDDFKVWPASDLWRMPAPYKKWETTFTLLRVYTNTRVGIAGYDNSTMFCPEERNGNTQYSSYTTNGHLKHRDGPQPLASFQSPDSTIYVMDGTWSSVFKHECNPDTNPNRPAAKGVHLGMDNWLIMDGSSRTMSWHETMRPVDLWTK